MQLNVSAVLLLASIVFAVVAALGGFGWWDWAGQYAVGFLAASLACFEASYVRWDRRAA